MCIFIGTGKTNVLVAAIEEILRDEHKENVVLVCANSNAACNELFERLMKVLDYFEILRLYTTSYNPKQVDPQYLKCSNYDRRVNAFTMPDLRYFY